MSRSLLPHQVDTLKLLEFCEESQYILNPKTGFIQLSSAGILGNPPGTGKTAVILSLIKERHPPLSENRKVIMFSQFSPIPEMGIPNTLFGQGDSTRSLRLRPVPVSVVFCPKHTLYTWIDEADAVGTAYLAVDIPSRVNGGKISEFVRDRGEGGVIIVSTHIQRLFLECVHNIFVGEEPQTVTNYVFFQRIIFDDIYAGEWQSPRGVNICGAFMWFICTDFDLVPPSRMDEVHLMTRMIPYAPGRPQLNLHRVFRTLGDAYTLPSAILKRVYYQDNTLARRLREHIPPEISQLLETGDFATAYSIMAGNGGGIDIAERKPLPVIIEDRYKSKLEALNEKRARITERGLSTQCVDADILELRKLMENLRERVRHFSEGGIECPICMEKIAQGDRVIVKCCNNVFCSVCIGTTIHKYSKCPLCREPLTLRGVYSMDSGGEVIDLDYTKPRNLGRGEREYPVTPMEALKRILDRKAGGKFVVFAPLEKTSLVYKRYFQDYGIHIDSLDGKAEIIHRKIKALREGKLSILFVSGKTVFTGLNLQFVTDVVVIGSNTREGYLKQILNQVRRFPRTDPIPVHHIQRLV